MPNKKIVINASPLILLCKGDLEGLFPRLFSEILIPTAVWDEIMVGSDVASDKIRSASWLKRVTSNISSNVLVWNLGDGESKVLSFADANREYAVVIDDRAARNCANTLGIDTLGTGAILVLAKRGGYIDSVTTALSRLRGAGLYISDEIGELLKGQANEWSA